MRRCRAQYRGAVRSRLQDAVEDRLVAFQAHVELQAALQGRGIAAQVGDALERRGL